MIGKRFIRFLMISYAVPLWRKLGMISKRLFKQIKPFNKKYSLNPFGLYFF